MVKFKDPIPKKTGKELEVLFSTDNMDICFKEALRDNPDWLPIFTTLNVYRIDQLILSHHRRYDINQKQETGYAITYGAANGFLTPKKVKDWLVENGYPLAEDYIEPLPDISGE